MRVVIDTNVLAAGLRSRNGASSQLFSLIGTGVVVPLVSIALFLQYEAVLKRHEHLEASGLASADVDDILATIANLAQAVDIYFRWRPQLIDVADEMVLDVAVNGRADALVTYNARHLEDACLRFGVPVFNPADVIRRVR